MSKFGSFFVAAAQDAAIPAAAPHAVPPSHVVTTGQMAPAAQTAAGAAQSTVQAAPPSHTGSLVDAVQQSAGSWGGYFEALAVLFLILALLWLVVWFLRKRGGVFSGNGPVMYIESRLNMGQKKWLVIARVHGKRLVLGVTDHTITLVKELPEDLPVQKKEESFASMLKKNVAKEDPPGES